MMTVIVISQLMMIKLHGRFMNDLLNHYSQIMAGNKHQASTFSLETPLSVFKTGSSGGISCNRFDMASWEIPELNGHLIYIYIHIYIYTYIYIHTYIYIFTYIYIIYIYMGRSWTKWWILGQASLIPSGLLSEYNIRQLDS